MLEIFEAFLSQVDGSLAYKLAHYIQRHVLIVYTAHALLVVYSSGLSIG